MNDSRPQPRLRPLLSAEQIGRRVEQLAGELAAIYAGRPLDLLPILAGSVIFLADLVRKLPLEMVIHVCAVSSYRGTSTQPDELVWTLPPPDKLAGRHVLVLDDILDTGQTLRRVCRAVGRLGPASVTSCVLLSREHAGFQADLVGFHIPDGFVVGYGLDFDGRFRNLPYIAVLEQAGTPPGGEGT